MITSNETMRFYIKADRMMNRGKFTFDIKDFFKNIISPDYVMRYLKYLRKAEYFSNRGGIMRYFYKIKLHRLGSRIGFSIAQNVFGYGLVIPHYGTIVVGSGNVIGNYCVLHTSTCITAGNKHIGNGFYCSTGAKVLNDVVIGDNVIVGANAVLNKDIKGNSLVVGIPATFKHSASEWYTDDYERRVKMCEELRDQMGV